MPGPEAQGDNTALVGLASIALAAGGLRIGAPVLVENAGPVQPFDRVEYLRSFGLFGLWQLWRSPP